MIEENYLYRASFGNFRKGFKILAVVSSRDFFAYFLCQDKKEVELYMRTAYCIWILIIKQIPLIS